jgi:7-cyano-7-deazaguanine tRNA-ribosyltransferase
LNSQAFLSHHYTYGRTAKLRLVKHTLNTPILFPVACLITGTTPRGGGIWKYVLQADINNGLLRRNIPIMSQVLHFLDFASVDKKTLLKWRDKGIKKYYCELIEPTLDYDAPIFLDSGGFKLLWNTTIDLSNFGLSINDGIGPETIIKLQKDLGGDIVASLDYPLPPGLEDQEIKQRMKGSYENAVIAAQILRNQKEYQPFFFVATHGDSRESIGQYVRDLFSGFRKDDLLDYPFGLAIGSLVPLRGAKKVGNIIELILGVIENIPKEHSDKIPIHVFGITGNLIPILAFLGVDSFDSSTYVQQARNLRLIDPISHHYRPVLELDSWKCDCRVCEKSDFSQIQEALTSEITNRPNKDGFYKSKYYSDIALHNLEMDFRIVEKTRLAIESDSLIDFIIEHAHKYPEVSLVPEILIQKFKNVKFELPYISPSQQTKKNSEIPIRTISLNYSPSSFNVLDNGYFPPKNKKILLLIPCSSEKPYSISRSHRFITTKLNNEFGPNASLIHKITLSGLYGPVPEEYEQDSTVINYDFRLESYNENQISLITKRLVTFLEIWGSNYEAILSYATSRPYRKVFNNTAKVFPSLVVLPEKPSSQSMTMFYKKEYLSELIKAIAELLFSGEQE